MKQLTDYLIPRYFAHLRVCKISIIFFLLIFSLEIWWDVIRHQGKPVLQFPNISWIYEGQIFSSNIQRCPSKELHFFQSHTQSYSHSWHFLCGNFNSNVFVFCSRAFWSKTTNNFGNVEKGFCSITRHNAIIPHADRTSKDAFLSCESVNVFTDSVTQSGRRFCLIVTSKRTIGALCGSA